MPPTYLTYLTYLTDLTHLTHLTSVSSDLLTMEFVVTCIPIN